MKYIGLDAHSSTCTFSVMTENGAEIDSMKIETNGRLLVKYLKEIKGKKKLTFEECELSSWLHETLKSEVDELIVCNPTCNGNYKKKKTDKLDARALAKLLRGDFLVGVYHDSSDREKFRGLIAGYQDLIGDGVRLKNRYKSLFRKNGLWVKGKGFYSNEDLLEGLTRKDFHFVGTHIYELLSKMEEIRKNYLEEIKTYSEKFKEIKLLKGVPGIGAINAAKIVAQVINPKRFRNKYKYYSYCGLVRHRQLSGDRSYGSKKIWGNRTLKDVYKTAALSALKGNNALRKHYDYLIDKGAGHKNARSAIARKIAAISLSVWRNNKKYCEDMIINGLIK
ncbi:MAG: IS110 family transposase [Candidatus Auribacterota bacterium]|nr:IS110 family transposase [Candidatus Auribacterota bacterium]